EASPLGELIAALIAGISRAVGCTHQGADPLLLGAGRVGPSLVEALVARDQVGPRRREPGHEDLLHPRPTMQSDSVDEDGSGLYASWASPPTSSPSSGESLIPGISGATRTPEGIPASLPLATASSRLRGCGVCGSVSRQILSSSVGTEKLTETSATSASSR